jgi:hypothetical protein
VKSIGSLILFGAITFLAIASFHARTVCADAALASIGLATASAIRGKTLEKSIALTLLLWATLTPWSTAGAVGYTFLGKVTAVSPILTPVFNLGDVVSGHMDINVAANFSSPQLSYYAVSDFTANIGGHYPIIGGPSNLAILNNFGGFVDKVQLDETTGLGLIASPVLGLVPDYFVINLGYNINDLSSSQLLPHIPPATLVDNSRLRFNVDDAITVSFTVTTFSAVPEPRTWFFVVIGMPFALLARARLSRNLHRV